MTIVWVVASPTEGEELRQLIARGKREQMPDSLRMIIGVINDPQSEDGGFCPYEEFSYNEVNPSFQPTAFGSN